MTKLPLPVPNIPGPKYCSLAHDKIVPKLKHKL